MAFVQKNWIRAVIGLASLAFAAAGIGKLMGNPMMHASFAKLGMPGWFGYFIGCCEIAGAVGLYLRKLSALAAAGLAIIMIGAVGYHVTYDPIGNAVPALVLLILSAIVVMKRRGDAFWAGAS